MKKKRSVLKKSMTLMISGAMLLQGTSPVFAAAGNYLRNQPRWVSFEQPQAIRGLELYIQQEPEARKLSAEEIRDLIEASSVSPLELSGEVTEDETASSEENTTSSEITDEETTAEEEASGEEASEETSPAESENASESSDAAVTESESVESRPETAPEESSEAPEDPAVILPTTPPEAPFHLYPVETPEGELVSYDENSRTYQLGDHRFRTIIGNSGTYTDESGEVQLIDNTLQGVQTFSGDGEGTDYVNTANSYLALIPASLATDGVYLEKDGCTLQVIPQGGDFSRPVAEDNAVRYQAVYDLTTDVQYTVTDFGLKEDILLLAAPQTEVAYSYELIFSEGMTAETTDAGVYLYVPGAEEPTFFLCAPEMSDAAGECSMKLSLSYSDTEQGQHFLTVTPDFAWLSDPARVFPVRIDPSQVVIPPSAIGLYGIDFVKIS